jgi:hypothetical protein
MGLHGRLRVNAGNEGEAGILQKTSRFCRAMISSPVGQGIHLTVTLPAGKTPSGQAQDRIGHIEHIGKKTE